MALKSRERVGDGKRRRETEGGKEWILLLQQNFSRSRPPVKGEGCAARTRIGENALTAAADAGAAHTFLPFIARCAPDFPSVCPPSVRLARHPLRTISPARVIVFSAIMEREVRILGGFVKSYLTINLSA